MRRFPKSELSISGISFFEKQWALCPHWREPDHSSVDGEDVVVEPQTPEERPQLFALVDHLHMGADLAQRVYSGL